MRISKRIADRLLGYWNDELRASYGNNGRDLVRYALEHVDTVDTRGTPIYEREWDVLIVLDACRVDLLESIAHEYPFLPDTIASERSLASCTRLWMDRNFTDEYRSETRRTGVVVGNPYSESHLDAARFRTIDEVWRYAWDADLGTVPSRAITDRAIDTARGDEYDRLIVHYMQPHFPSVPDPLGSEIDLDTFGDVWCSVWDRLCEGEIGERRVWRSYEANLRYVLEDVRHLLSHLDADRVVITSDHGNAFGEWLQYGHPPRTPISVLREVPWVEVSAEDTDEYEPSLEPIDEDEREDAAEERLKQLGYL